MRISKILILLALLACWPALASDHCRKEPPGALGDRIAASRDCSSGHADPALVDCSKN